MDWHRFLLLVRRHRIQALAFEGLRRLGVEAPAAHLLFLESEAREIVSQNLDIAQECKRVGDAFQSANVPLVFLKGLPLAALSYPNPFLKMGWDIDILIASKTVPASAAILTDLGYRQVIPVDKLEGWHRRRKESVWSRDGRFFIELHTRLADNRAMLQGIDVHAPNQSVQVTPGISLTTLADEELFAYLCVHGTGSCWSRLKWLSDLAAFLERRNPSEIEGLYERSCRLGAGRCAATALLLADDVFEVSLREDFQKDLRQSPAVRALVRISQNYLGGRFELTEPTELAGGTVGIHFAQLLLKPGLPYAINESIRQVGDFFSDAADRSKRAKGVGTASGSLASRE